MSYKYDIYLTDHKNNVAKAYYWLRGNLPEVVDGWDIEYQVCNTHDLSKSEPSEYIAYDEYFYGGNKSYEVVKNFNYAWLKHIHHNPHHWQYWCLINDVDEPQVEALDMPFKYIVEMLCDWQSAGNHYGNTAYDWYEKQKEKMILSENTRKTVEKYIGYFK